MKCCPSRTGGRGCRNRGRAACDRAATQAGWGAGASRNAGGSAQRLEPTQADADACQLAGAVSRREPTRSLGTQLCAQVRGGVGERLRRCCVVVIVAHGEVEQSASGCVWHASGSARRPAARASNRCWRAVPATHPAWALGRSAGVVCRAWARSRGDSHTVFQGSCWSPTPLPVGQAWRRARVRVSKAPNRPASPKSSPDLPTTILGTVKSPHCSAQLVAPYAAVRDQPYARAQSSTPSLPRCRRARTASLR